MMVVSDSSTQCFVVPVRYSCLKCLDLLEFNEEELFEGIISGQFDDVNVVDVLDVDISSPFYQ